MFINLRIILVSIVLLLVLAVATTDSASASIQDPQSYHRVAMVSHSGPLGSTAPFVSPRKGIAWHEAPAMKSALGFIHAIVAIVTLPILAIMVFVVYVAEGCERLWKGTDAKKGHKDYWRKNHVRSKESREIAAIVHRQIIHERQKRGLRWLYYDHHLAFIARGP